MLKKILVPLAALGVLTALAGGRTYHRRSHTYEITIENLTKGQGFSPPVFFSHSKGMHLFQPGHKASLGICRIAEEGNNAPIMLMALSEKKHGKVDDVETGIPIEPGKTQTVRVSTDDGHPMISGAWMLGMTNDGFAGLDGVDTGVIGDGQTVKTLMGWDAGTERNDERQTDMISLMGPNRNPENGVIHLHPGIRGNHDAPKKWKFHGPVAKVTIKRVS